MSLPASDSPAGFLRLTPDAPIAEKSTFLSLAPSTSSSYPQAAPPAHRDSVGSGSSPPSSVPDPSSAAAAAEEAQEPRRRSSSSTEGPKILKLGPVHWGEHLDEHKDDFHHLASSSPP